MDAYYKINYKCTVPCTDASSIDGCNITENVSSLEELEPDGATHCPVRGDESANIVCTGYLKVEEW